MVIDYHVTPVVENPPIINTLLLLENLNSIAKNLRSNLY